MITTPSDYIKRLGAIQQSVSPTIEMIKLGTEPLFIINTATREITVPPAMHQLGVVSDHNAETIYLQIGRYFDDVDLSQKTCVIQYINAADEKHLYPITEKYIDEEKGKLTFAWKLSGNVTKAAGIISFSVRFYEIENDAYLYNFNTKTASFMISDGLDIREDMSIAPSPTDIIILVEHLDQVASQTANDAQQTLEERVKVESLVDSVVKTITDKKDGAVKEINTIASNQIGKIGSEGAAQINKIQQKGNDTLESIPNDYTQLSNGVSDLKHKDIRNSSMFSNTIIGEATGKGHVMINDAANATIPYLEVDGASEQVVTTGAQLFDAKTVTYINNASSVKDVTKTDTGVKFTTAVFKNADGVYCNESIPHSGVCTVSCDVIVSSKDFNKIKVRLSENIAKQIDASEFTNNQAHLSVTGDVMDNKTLTLYVDNTDKTNPITVEFANIMIAKGDTALPWEPYTGGKPSPSPEYPQEIVSVAHVANSGAQLLNLKSRAGSQTKNGITLTINDDGSVKVNGTATDGATFALSSNGYMSLDAGKNYTIRGYGTDFDNNFFWQCWIKDPGGSYKDTGAGATFLYTKASDFNFSVLVKSGKTVNATFWPMLNAGSTPIPWEPYNGQQREIDFKVESSGKNLFDKSAAYSYIAGAVEITQLEKGIRISNATARVFAAAAVKLKLKPYTTYTYSCDITALTTKSTVGIRKSTDGGKSYIATLISSFSAEAPAKGLKRTFTTDSYTDYVLCFFCTNDVELSGATTFENIQLEEGNKATAWEPYAGYQKVTIPLTEPLRGIGDVKDRFCMRDGVWGIERLIEEYIFTENDSFTLMNENEHTYLFIASKVLNTDQSTYITNYHCNYFISGNAEFDNNIIGSYIFVKNIRFRVPGEIASNMEEFKTWLTEHPIQLIYPMATPTWEPFPAEIQAALNALTTHPGTTYLTVTSTDVAVPMRLEYVQDINKAITQLYTTINELKASLAK